MDFQEGDWVIFDGLPCRVQYANDDVVVFARTSDQHLMMRTPRQLAAEQVPWVLRPQGWWSQMRDIIC